ncbi:hypothetical protein MTR_8g442490 [Medicago truncatula]|uniref:Uncharacterized protein n=1 Tax=Medicago truncatula TaxID=3880 RepID=A0A072U044_MEDTR|nr:hypothetical protein MTR_8g442490 [Medicago truncatula]
MDIKIFVEPDTKDGSEGQQCQAYIIYKGRQCIRLAIRNAVYICAHFSRKKKITLKILVQFVEVQLLLVLNACKHHSLLVLVNPKSPLEIYTMSVVNNDDSFFAKKILGELQSCFFGNDHKEIKVSQWRCSPNHG